MRGAISRGGSAVAGPDTQRAGEVGVDSGGSTPAFDAAEGPSLEFYPASGALLPLVETYYLSRWNAEEIRGVDRVDMGQLRFMLRGEGTLTYADGRCEPSCPVMITAPASAAVRYHVAGPFHCFGVSLREIGWRSLLGVPASDLADRVVDAADVLGPEVHALLAELRTMERIEDMVGLVEPILAARRRPTPPAHIEMMRQFRAWTTTPDLDIETLYASVDMSRRQIMRLCNEYYGGPPTHLRRKYRAITAAIRLRNGEAPGDVAAPFADQSHMINEVKHFTGQTPTSLSGPIDPVLAAVLDRESFQQLTGDFLEMVDPDAG